MKSCKIKVDKLTTHENMYQSLRKRKMMYFSNAKTYGFTTRKFLAQEEKR